MIDPTCPKLATLVEAQLVAFPDHADYLGRRFADLSADEWAFAEEIAGLMLTIAGDELAIACADYRWLTQVVLEEELFFRREGRYRLSRFADAVAQVYDDPVFMSRYVSGLLVTQIWWRNYADGLKYFRDRFLAGTPSGFSHLEIGPGHGLLLYMAAASARCAHAEGWDISESSLACTRHTLDRLPQTRAVVLRKVDMMAAPKTSFSSIVFSEVLEHLEEPRQALHILYDLLTPGGRIFIKAPVNSPAPDHLYLFSTPEAVRTMVEEAGFAVVDTFYAPCTGSTLERARRMKLSISASIIATKG